jgi:DNA-binding transcriptional LysR family regulator
MQKIEWHLLEYFRSVGRHEHVSHAASELGSSQPAVSRAIRSLERTLGAPLFDRVGRSVVLTKQGRQFLQVVDRAHGEIEEALVEIFGQSKSSSRSVALGFLRTLGSQLVPQTVRRFKERHPSINFMFSQNNTNSIETELEKGEVDLIFTAVPTHSASLGWHRLSDQELVLIASTNHKLARKKDVRLKDLRCEAFVTFKPGHVVRTLTDRLCSEAGFVPTISFEGDDSSSIPGFVAAGFGVAIVPRDGNLPSGVTILRTAGPLLRRQIGLAWRNDQFMHSNARAFKAFVLEG